MTAGRIMRVHQSMSMLVGRAVIRPGPGRAHAQRSTSSCCSSASLVAARGTAFAHQRLTAAQPTASSLASVAYQIPILLQQQQLQRPLIIQPSILLTQQQQQQQQQTRQLSSRSSSRKGNKKKKGGVDPNAPLLNEHLIAELFNKMKGSSDNQNISADTYEVRLIVDRGFDKKKAENSDDDEDDSEDESSSSSDNKDSGSSSTTTTTTTQVVTLNEAITISHNYHLDLMAVTLQQSPPVLKAVDYDKFMYDQKRKAIKASSQKKKEGGGAISDRPLKEFKFRAGIADHDLQRKTKNMLNYLEKGHAIRVTLTARQRSLNADAAAIETTLERVKELVGDKAVEARGMKANDRKSYGSLLLHPNKGGK